MKRIVLIVTAVVIVLAAVAGWGLAAARAKRERAMIPEYEQRLTDPNPMVRLDAADRLLDLEPGRPGVRLTRAEALVELGKHSEARDLLAAIAEERTGDLAAVLRLHVDSYLREASELVARNAESGVELLEPRIESLLSGADRIMKVLEARTDQQAEVLMARARQLDVRSALLRLEAKGKRVELLEARAVNFDEEAERLGVLLTNLESRVEKLNTELAGLCERVLEMDPGRLEARRLLFGMLLRARRFDEARQVAEQIAEQPQIDGVAAGWIAGVLLNLERLHWRPPTEGDVVLARRLLRHPNLSRADHPTCQMARLRLLLREGEAEAAEEIARRLRASRGFASHPQVQSLLARALIHQGRAAEAEALIHPLIERMRTSLMSYTLGLAYLAQGKRALAKESLRQSLELDPENLPARLVLAETLVDEGFVVEAGPDILAAAELSPAHPKVLALQARLLVEKLDHRGLAKMLEHQVAGPEATRRAEDVVLAAALVVGDEGRVRRITEKGLTEDPADVLKRIAMGWLLTDADRRARVASVVVRLMLPLFDADPLAHPDPPPVASYARYRASKVPVPDTQAHRSARALRRLSVSQHVPWPEEDALTLVTIALEKWPQDPRLLAYAGELNIWLGRASEARAWLARLSTPEAEQVGAVPMIAYLDGDAVTLEQAVRAAESSGSVSPRLRMLQFAAALRIDQIEEARDALEKLLTVQPWAELAVLAAVRDAIAQFDLAGARQWVELAAASNRRLGALVSSRLALALDRPMEATLAAESLAREEENDSEIRRRAAELRARADLALGRPQLAAGVFENLALSLPHQKLDLGINALDVLIESGRHLAAAAMLRRLAGDPRTPPMAFDQLLARARVIMEPDRLRHLIGEWLEYRQRPPKELLLCYRAMLEMEAAEFAEADETLKRVQEVRPDAPRVLMARARLEVLRGRPEEAAAIYGRLIERGGRAAEAAKRQLDRLPPLAPPASAPASPPGSAPASPPEAPSASAPASPPEAPSASAPENTPGSPPEAPPDETPPVSPATSLEAAAPAATSGPGALEGNP